MGRYTNSKQKIEKKSAQQNIENSHSNTKKATISFPKATHYDQEESNTPVFVYLHSHNIKSLKIELGPKISISDLKNIIEDKIGIKKDRQLLYLNGKNITQYGYIRLQTHSIIHISNSDEICSSNRQIHLKMTIINFVGQKQQKVNKTIIVQPNQLISNFLIQLQKEIGQIFNFNNQNVQYYLLESSRILQKQKTFQEQDITRQSDIICMVTEHEVRTRFTNDTKEEILHDISELLGFNDQAQTKSPPKEERSIRPRYSREQAKRQQVQKPPEQEESQHLTNSVTIPNFKKKRAPISKAASFEDSPTTGLAKKLKSLKKKKDLDYLLNSQERQKLVFESPQIVKEQVKQQEIRQQSPQIKAKRTSEIPKAAPQIPKVMPINERRQIRLQIEKLFDLGDSSTKEKPITLVENSDPKEQKKPISPPTETPRQKQKLRLSLGSRPAFLDQLRNLKTQ